MSDEDKARDEADEERLDRSAVPKSGGPKWDARCSQCGVVQGTKHMKDCPYA
jgi:hypothetical protein